MPPSTDLAPLLTDLPSGLIIRSRYNYQYSFHHHSWHEGTPENTCWILRDRIAVCCFKLGWLARFVRFWFPNRASCQTQQQELASKCMELKQKGGLGQQVDPLRCSSTGCCSWIRDGILILSLPQFKHEPAANVLSKKSFCETWKSLGVQINVSLVTN